VINGLAGPVTTFVVEPFVPHDEEYYLSIQSGRWVGSSQSLGCVKFLVSEGWEARVQVCLLLLVQSVC